MYIRTSAFVSFKTIPIFNTTDLRKHYLPQLPLPAADGGGGCSRCAPPWPKMFSIPCSFLENMAKWYVGYPRGLAPPPWGILDPPLVVGGKKCTILPFCEYMCNSRQTRKELDRGGGALGDAHAAHSVISFNFMQFPAEILPQGLVPLPPPPV